MKQVAGFPNSSGTRMTSTALSLLQAARSGVAASEHTKTRAVSIASTPFRAELTPSAGLYAAQHLCETSPRRPLSKRCCNAISAPVGLPFSAGQAGDRPLAPELARGEPGALGHAGEFGPDHGGIDRGLPDPGAVAAIAAGDDVLAADQLGVAGEALGDEFGMLDEIGLGFEDAGDEDLARRQLDRLEHRPFVGVARVSRLEREAARLGQEDHVDDVLERHVAMMRALVIAPAQMEAQLLRRDVGDGVVERLDVKPRLLAEILDAQMCVLDVPAHGEVRAVELQHEPGLGDALVFRPHRLGDGEEIGLVAGIMAVVEEQIGI